MVLLKLKGPRRRESGRIKDKIESQSPIETNSPSDDELSPQPSEGRRGSIKPNVKTTSPSTKLGKRTKSASPLPATPEDTIRVKSKKISIFDDSDDSPLSDLEDLEAMVDAEPPPPKTGTNRPWARSGKAPVANVGELKDVEMADADDNVEEYDFSNETEVEDEEDDGEDTNPLNAADDVITISSDDDREETFDWTLNDRPWKEFGREERSRWEQMYCKLTDYPLNGDWRNTEEYQEHKDLEMGRYMEDFPLSEWVIPQDQAETGYNQLLDRTKWRSLGIPIYGRHPIPTISRPQQSFFHQPAQNRPSLSHPSSMRPQQMPQQMQQPTQRGPMPHHMPQGVGPGMHQHMSQSRPPSFSRPPPYQVLPSQPTAQPYPKQPNGTPAYQPKGVSSIPPSNVPQEFQGFSSPPGQSVGSDIAKGKELVADSLPVDSSMPPGLIPPYKMREKPIERRTVIKHGRRAVRRPGELDVFPWNRDMDFKEAGLNAKWDDSIYDKARLDSMAAARARNEAKIERMDAEENQRLRASRMAKKKGTKADDDSDTEKPKTPKKKTASSPAVGGPETASGDVNHTGHFCFATSEDHQKALALGMKIPDDLLYAAEEGKVSKEVCNQIIIYWHPGKKAANSELEMLQFSVKDTMATREQLARSPILTRRAGERIVDFCPDLLYQKLLLQIISESGLGNKDVRDRMCCNGNVVDKATVTKRIGAALGQKQQQSTHKMKGRESRPAADPADEKIKGYARDEVSYFNDNIADYQKYMDYFGKQTSHRAQLVLDHGNEQKRKVIDDDYEDGDGSSGVDMKAPAARRRSKRSHENAFSSEANTALSSESAEPSSEGAEGAEPTSDSTSGNESADSRADAVSVQSDTILDAMDED